MVKAGKWIARHRILILIIGILLLVPSVFGIAATKVNYELLSYLPEDLETVKGQDILVDEYGMGAFSMAMVEGMAPKDVQKLKTEFEEVPHVSDVLWYDDVVDISLPVEMIPQDIRKVFSSEDATMLLVLFDNTTSSDEAMNALTEIRHIADRQCFIGGMTGIVTDIKDLCMQELPVYVLIATALAFLILELTGTSFLVPVFLLLSIGASILYNMGSNVFLGEISYITQALTAVLQLGVTMDYSIFLLNSYEENKRRFPGEKERAMGHAIANTFKSVVGSSVTTVAGFAALCFMTFALGKDMGIVMAKGVVIGVICCVTFLPALVLIFDGAIERTKHRQLIRNLDKPSAFITRHYKVWILLFVVLLFPAVYGNNHTETYYNIAQSLPEDLSSNEANEKLKEDFDMENLHMILLDKDTGEKEKNLILSGIDEVDGVKWTFGLNSIAGPAIPKSVVPDDVREIMQSEDHELLFVCSEYEAATPEMNRQISDIERVVRNYDKDALVIGEAPMMKDLQDVTDRDLKVVNAISIIAIFLIILIVFRSLLLPVILVSVIEFAIFVNMAISYYQGVSLPFVASIVIGTIQLGATVDYAILMTSRYQKERLRGREKKEAISIAHKTSMLSIISSGLSFFAATFGVACCSEVDMIGAICTLLARGAIISMSVVILVLPAMFMIFDRAICRLTIGFPRKQKEKTVAVNS